MLDFRKRVDDPFGCVRVPPCQTRIKTDRVVVIWVFVQVVDAVAEIILKKEAAAQAEE